VGIGINCSIKSVMRKKWEDWISDDLGIVDGAAKDPSHQLVAEWIVAVYSNILGQTGRHSWMKTGFEWF